ncbi:hypothetical protein P152DRAFT_159593 [Eremomyces bilateralis CBS 781.70]|uniref:Oxysterol-binding protein n=1 Tax=Eremomyces bilateralis CBS 781.70 TaxID=1392243 RepID=A0A6G1FUY6_9PEZI|nr:uncharacterized protein P152DRAFT_159593 [Eremomyces bilateralis CBS 781.70]KAF1809518.1 hypothetical protein P152DRAFT_159593 [Eremomyces bilateralis CBS 781.70]
MAGRENGKSSLPVVRLEDDRDDDDEDYGDDASSNELQLHNRDAFNITAQSAKLHLDLLAQVSTALQNERNNNPWTQLSDPVVGQGLASYEAAVGNLKSLIGDLLRIGRDRESYWQYRLEQEGNVRRMWEESMTRVAKEQEALESMIGVSEDKRKRTKRALRDALEGLSVADSIPHSPQRRSTEFFDTTEIPKTEANGSALKAAMLAEPRRKSTLADMTVLSESESDDEEEFFDAIGAGEMQVVELPMSPQQKQMELPKTPEVSYERTTGELLASFKGYEDPVRERLAMDADDRPKISLWGILKSMIGKDMTKMTLPVSFNEPTSLLQRVAEDMEYTDLLDIAADCADPTERMVYVAAFAASEYASTIGRVAKPFNPLLGETFEYARPDKGYRFFIEQVSHHPPIGAAYAESPKWDYWGESAVKSKFYGKSFDVNPLGTWFLRLRPRNAPPELYTWKKVTSSVIGIITGNPNVDNYGPMHVRNWTTGEVCNLDFKARGWKASSAHQVGGKVLDADGKPRWTIAGRWNDKIYAKVASSNDDDASLPVGEVERRLESAASRSPSQAFLVWQCHGRPTDIPFNLTPFVVTLNALPDALRPHLAPTDTRLRPDQRAMEDGEYDFAATEKNRLEEKQRAKRRERDEAGEEFVPRWFRKGRSEETGETYWVFNGEYWKMRETGKWEGLEDIFSEAE